MYELPTPFATVDQYLIGLAGAVEHSRGVNRLRLGLIRLNHRPGIAPGPEAVQAALAQLADEPTVRLSYLDKAVLQHAVTRAQAVAADPSAGAPLTAGEAAAFLKGRLEYVDEPALRTAYERLGEFLDQEAQQPARDWVLEIQDESGRMPWEERNALDRAAERIWEESRQPARVRGLMHWTSRPVAEVSAEQEAARRDELDRVVTVAQGSVVVGPGESSRSGGLRDGRGRPVDPVETVTFEPRQPAVLFRYAHAGELVVQAELPSTVAAELEESIRADPQFARDLAARLVRNSGHSVGSGRTDRLCMIWPGQDGPFAEPLEWLPVGQNPDPAKFIHTGPAGGPAAGTAQAGRNAYRADPQQTRRSDGRPAIG